MARKWFNENNTEGLDISDLAILNRATRHLVDQGNSANARLLMEVRMTYTPGMSAQDVIDIVNDWLRTRWKS